MITMSGGATSQQPVTDLTSEKQGESSKTTTTKAPGELDLAKLLESVHPIVNPGEYLFLAVDDETLERIPRAATLFEFKEHRCGQHREEGTTVVVERQQAAQLGLRPRDDYVASWITLQVQSSLEAVGLTQHVAEQLAEVGVSANVVAAYHHDHVFVHSRDRDTAREALLALAEKHRKHNSYTSGNKLE